MIRCLTKSKRETPQTCALRYIKAGQDPPHVTRKWIDPFIGNYTHYIMSAI